MREDPLEEQKFSGCFSATLKWSELLKTKILGIVEKYKYVGLDGKRKLIHFFFNI